MSENPLSRDSQRVPLETRVQLKFEWFGGFISEYSANISPGGMFIRTQTPEPVGRMIGFELRLGDGYELIRGTGEVVWARPIDQGPDKQAGMGIRFLEISPDGRELIYQMVDNYIAQGGTPFDVTDMPGPSPAPAEENAPAEPQAAAAVLAAPTPASAMPAARPPQPAHLVPPSPVEAAPSWLPALPTPAFGAEPQAPSLAQVPAISDIPASDIPAAEVSPRSGSGLVRWAVVGGVLVLAAALAVFKQDVLLGWFLPAKGTRTAEVAPAPPPPHRRKVPLPAAPLSPASAGSPSPSAPSAAAVPDPAPTAAPVAKPAASAPAANPPATPPPPQPVEALPAAPTATSPAGSAAATTGVESGPGEIRKITWKQDPDGTEVILWADGAIRRQDWAPYRIDGDPPRELVKLYGIRHPFPSSRLVAGTRQLLQVRTGYHDGPKGNELHVVLDLTGPGVEVTGIEAQGEQLHVHLKGK
jgi:molecular chaperone DnaK